MLRTKSNGKTTRFFLFCFAWLGQNLTLKLTYKCLEFLLRSVLMMAACSGQISMVRLLLQYDADITVKDAKGWSSDDYAVMNGHHA